MMNAAVCVMVTVPTEKEEMRQFPHLNKKHFPEMWMQQPHSSSRALRLEELKADAPLEQILRCIAQQLRLEHVFWTQDVAGVQLQARFDLLQDERYERLLCTLQDWGIGERLGTHVTAINCLETRVKFSNTPAAAGEKGAGAGKTAAGGAEAGQDQRLGWQNFMDSVRCRLNVNQVVRLVRRDATINFDFVVLLMAAALLSCVGLVEDSFLFLSSSMLISPLMGPIIAAIFGSVIGDHGLRWLGVRNELIGIAISVVTGFIFGAAICLCGLSRFFVLSGGFTEEIITRCDTHSLAIGVCTALASGAAAAIGVLGGNTGSLVGVAISASLLPPAVNAGLLWAIALCAQLFNVDQKLIHSLAKHREYSQQLHIELFVCASVSMALTLLNVACCWLMGVVVLRIKEVAPAVQRDQEFWRHDVRLAREVALHDPELHSAIDRLDLNTERRQVDLEAPHYQHTWSPGTMRPRLCPESQFTKRNYHTVHGFQDLNLTMRNFNSEVEQPPRTASTSASPPLPRFMDVFTPLTPVECHQDVAKPVASSSATLGNYCSLPDLRQAGRSTDLPEHLTVKPRLVRSVHWGVPYPTDDDKGKVEPVTEDEEMLLPLPPDRRLRLLTTRNGEQRSTECEYEHEFNV